MNQGGQKRVSGEVGIGLQEGKEEEEKGPREKQALKILIRLVIMKRSRLNWLREPGFL